MITCTFGILGVSCFLSIHVFICGDVQQNDSFINYGGLQVHLIHIEDVRKIG